MDNNRSSMGLPSTINPSSSLPRNGPKPTIERLNFPNGWKAGPIFEKYNILFPCKNISKIQLRKESPNTIHHRFIVLFMVDGSVHRFDRRPKEGANGAQTLTGSPVESEDTCIANVDEASKQAIEKSTICEIELFLDGGFNDIISVFATCFIISQDEEARYYTLFRHNCYFFAWTILIIVSRQRLPHQIPSYEAIVPRYLEGISKVISKQIDRNISFGTEAVLQALLIFRERNKETVRPEVAGFLWKMLLSIPSGVVKAFGRGIMGVSSYLGVRQRIRRAIEQNIQSKANEIWKNGMELYKDNEPLDVHLWLNNLQQLMFPVVKKELRIIIWENIAEIFANACENEETIQTVQELVDRKRSRLWTREAWEFRAVCIAALYGSVSAVHVTLRDQPYTGNESHETVFNRLWSSASIGALSAAQKAAKNSENKVKDKESWERSWEPVWQDWQQAWDEALVPVRTQIVDSMIRAAVIDYADYGAKLLLDEMRQNDTCALKARFLKPEKHRWRPRKSEAKFTKGEIQDHIQKMMRENTTDEAYKAISSKMESIWVQARDLSRNTAPVNQSVEQNVVNGD